MKTIYSIHPAIGIARLGDSGINKDTGDWNAELASWFLGPEAPNEHFIPASYNHSQGGLGYGDFRNDYDQYIRRQAVRFRVYEKTVDGEGNVVEAKEITSDLAEMHWSVSLANRKAIAERFPPYHKTNLEKLGEHPSYPNTAMRNYTILDDNQRETELVISNNGSISGNDHPPVKVEADFYGLKVKLADLMTDSSGRLIFLGGHGVSDSPSNDNPLQPSLLEDASRDPNVLLPLRSQVGRHRLYNWDGWCDDTCDGQVSVEIEIDGQKIETESAWVVVAPPDFAAAARSPVTLYDVAYSANRSAKRSQGLPIPPLNVSFSRDVFPLLRRTVDLGHMSERGRIGHAGDSRGNFADPELLAILASKDDEHRGAKVMFMRRLTRPGAKDGEIDMPDLFGGVDPENPRTPPPLDALMDPSRLRRDRFGVPLTLTEHQFEILKKWAAHEFISDWPNKLPDFKDIELAEQPAALDKAALEQCNGGSFHPGIEISFVAGRADTYRIDATSWLRLKDKTKPGALTENLAIPWQHDFAGCSDLWWPGQRPVSVRTEREGQYVDWFPDIGSFEELFTYLRDAGFVRYHPDTGEIYMDPPVYRDLLIAHFDTGSEEALQVRELLARMRDDVLLT